MRIGTPEDVIKRGAADVVLLCTDSFTKEAFPRMAPVTAHYGYNNVEQYDPSAKDDPSRLIGGCTFEKPEKIIWIDELDEEDNVNVRLSEKREFIDGDKVMPD